MCPVPEDLNVDKVAIGGPMGLLVRGGPPFAIGFAAKMEISSTTILY
jgi:hypothetical protein